MGQGGGEGRKGMGQLAQDIVNLGKEFDFSSAMLSKTTGGVLRSSDKILLSSTSRSQFFR